MIPEKALVIYKNRPALVSGLEGDKINISLPEGGSVKVRGKDIELLHPGPCTSKHLDVPAARDTTEDAGIRETWELLTESESEDISLKELTELIYGDFSPSNAWAARELLKEGLYFTGDMQAIKARPRAIVEEEEKKREEKKRETGDRASFLDKLKKLPPFKPELGSYENLISITDRRFLQDVEALARGQSDKSRTLKELGRQESPEEAHRLLLASGVWTIWENPHPERHGLVKESAKIIPPAASHEDRLDLTHLDAYAIDSPLSDDPDDALSLEVLDEDGTDGVRHRLWVHIADPASAISPDSPADIEARGRGASLYLPEGTSRMLATEALPLFALGYADVSPAMSFKISLNPDLTISDIEIHPSLVKVTRLSYVQADDLISKNETVLAKLAALAECNVERRLDTGAVMIEMPEVHIHVCLDKKEVSIDPIAACRSSGMVRECMIWAGEGAARWAIKNKVPFPFISQEAGELPAERLPGLAGAWQFRRSMRPRSLSSKPGVHWGLGLDEYTQVTSPLRRYTDLICHQQIRACIGAGVYSGLKPLTEEEVLFRVSAAEAAASAAIRAERASRSHWLAVYLSDKKSSLWDGIVLDRKGNRGTVIIPALGLETQVSLRGNEEPNNEIKLSLTSVRIPEGEAVFSAV